MIGIRYTHFPCTYSRSSGTAFLLFSSFGLSKTTSRHIYSLTAISIKILCFRDYMSLFALAGFDSLALREKSTQNCRDLLGCRPGLILWSPLVIPYVPSQTSANYVVVKLAQGRWQNYTSSIYKSINPSFFKSCWYFAQTWTLLTWRPHHVMAIAKKASYQTLSQAASGWNVRKVGLTDRQKAPKSFPYKNTLAKQKHPRLCDTGRSLLMLRILRGIIEHTIPTTRSFVAFTDLLDCR